MSTHRLYRHAVLPLALSVFGWLGGCVTTTTTTPATGPRTSTTTTSKKTPPPAPPEGTITNSLNAQASDSLIATATRQVIAREVAFAQTMADRDFKSFVTFLSHDAVFFSGSEVARGPTTVAAKWEVYFSGRQAPFSWKPDHVEVLASGDLALSTGWVYENGKATGRFNSIWRLEADKVWRVVFDKGEAICGMTP